MNPALEHARSASDAVAAQRAREKALDDLIQLAWRRVAEGWSALDAHIEAQRLRIAKPGPARIAPRLVDPPAASLPASKPNRDDDFLAAIARRLQH